MRTHRQLPQALLGDKRHKALFVGDQAKGTPGQIIQQYGLRGCYVDLDGERVAIPSGIETLGSYSARADQNGLLNFATRKRPWTRGIRRVHGELGVERELAEALKARYVKVEKQLHPKA